MKDLTTKSAILPHEQMADALLSQNKDKLIVTGAIGNGELAFITAGAKAYKISLEFFVPSGTASPDFDDFRIGDSGHTLCFGEYEADGEWVIKNAEEVK